MNRAEFDVINMTASRHSVGQAVFVYGLVDPRTIECRYIGKSIRPLERLRNHVNEPPSNCHRSHWIQELKRAGLEPDMVIFERIDGEWPWQEAERFWIARGRALGWPLTNNTDGGDGVVGLSPEARAKIVATWKGRKHRAESIEKMRKASTGHVASESTRRKMSRAQTGRKIAWIGKISEANTKLSVDEQADVERRLAAGEGVCAIARELGMHRTSISKIKKGTYRGTR